MIPKTRYARNRDVHIAYQVLGDGPVDMLLVQGWITHLEAAWEQPRLADAFHRMASFSRLILMDKRGTGLSDPVANDQPAGPTERIGDLLAVLDAVGSRQAVLFGISEGGPICIQLAAQHPTRTLALVLYGTWARAFRDPARPWGIDPADLEQKIEDLRPHWGEGAALELIAPSLAEDEAFRDWWARYERMSASPAMAVGLSRQTFAGDVRRFLSSVAAPTLVLHRTDDSLVDVRHAREIARGIPGAQLVELPGVDHSLIAGDADAICDEVESFVTGTRPSSTAERVLSTVLFVDIVSSTEHAVKLGDRRWHELLDRYRSHVRSQLAHYQGRECGSSGDGFLATFDAPARAIRCAQSIVDAIAPLGIEIRAGLHTGEVEVGEDGISGIAVHIGARIMALAEPGEVLVSNTVHDLVTGSGIAFRDRGGHELRGVPGERTLFAVETNRRSREADPQDAPMDRAACGGE